MVRGGYNAVSRPTEATWSGEGNMLHAVGPAEVRQHDPGRVKCCIQAPPIIKTTGYRTAELRNCKD